MNKKIIMLLLIFPLTVKAYCNTEQISRYKQLASNVNNYYEYNSDDNTFNITIYNISDGLYIKETNTNTALYPNNNEVTFSKKPGNIITIGVFPQECPEQRVYTSYINLPYYNEYHKDPACNNNSNILCSKWANTSNMSYEEFIKKVKQKEPTVEIPPEPETPESSFSFLEFLGKYYIVILLTIIISGTFAIYKLDKKNKFDFKV